MKQKKQRFNEWKKPIIREGKLTKWNWVVAGVKNLKMGKFVDVGAFCYINAKDGVEIEDNVQIGGGVKIYSQDTIGGKSGKVILKNNCKIGANSVILPNSIVGKNSIVGAFSLVKGQTIPDNEIWLGVPAKKIGEIKNSKRIYKN